MVEQHVKVTKPFHSCSLITIHEVVIIPGGEEAEAGPGAQGLAGAPLLSCVPATRHFLPPCLLPAQPGPCRVERHRSLTVLWGQEPSLFVAPLPGE